MPRTQQEYNYDFPVPSNSSLIAPSAMPQRKSNALRRRRSPSPPSRTYHAPHFPTHHSTKYTPSTRQAEVSRLLDPSYSNIQQGSSSSKTNSPLSVFVDHYGDIHDPDYRHFPALPTRPKWETNGEDDDEEMLEDEKAINNSRRKSFETYAYRPSYAYYQYEAPSPSSFASELDESPFDDDASPVEKTEKNKLSKKYRGRRHSHVEEKQALARTEEEPNAVSVAAPECGADYTPSEYGDHDWT